MFKKPVLRTRKPILHVGDVFEGTARDILSDGRAVVAHPKGPIFFVAGLWKDETAKCRVSEFKGRSGTADVVSIQHKSSARIEQPKCQFHGHTTDHCGGCPWLYIDYQEQLKAKQLLVEHSIKKSRQGSLLSSSKEFHKDNKIIAAIWPSPSTEGYRNRAQFKTDGKKLGYVASKENRVVDVSECIILTDKNQETLKQLRQQLPSADWKPGKKAPWVTLDIDENISADKASVNQRLSFQQANTQQNQRMKSWLKETLQQLPPQLSVIELFCGSGNFTEILAASDFSHILAAESDPRALLAIEKRQWANVETYETNLLTQDGINRVFRMAPNARVLVLDPPRDGMKIKPDFKNIAGNITDIIYISCNLATFSRDIDEFYALGFKLANVQPLDQCPHTPHIEVLSHLTYKK